MGKNKKKDRTVYIDDGRSIADMSGISGPRLSDTPGRYRASFKEQWQTYIGAVKMMVKPMITVILALCVVFGIAYILLSIA